MVSFQEWTCFYPGHSPSVRNLRAKSKGKICKVQSTQSPLRGMWGEAAGACKVWEELCDEVTEGWRLAIEVEKAAQGNRESHRAAFLATLSNCPKPCTCKTFPISCPKFVAGVHAEDMIRTTIGYEDWRAWAEENGWWIDFHDGYPLLLAFVLLMTF